MKLATESETDLDQRPIGALLEDLERLRVSIECLREQSPQALAILQEMRECVLRLTVTGVTYVLPETRRESKT